MNNVSHKFAKGVNASQSCLMLHTGQLSAQLSLFLSFSLLPAYIVSRSRHLPLLSLTIGEEYHCFTGFKTIEKTGNIITY